MARQAIWDVVFTMWVVYCIAEAAVDYAEEAQFSRVPLCASSLRHATALAALAVCAVCFTDRCALKLSCKVAVCD